MPDSHSTPLATRDETRHAEKGCPDCRAARRAPWNRRAGLRPDYDALGTGAEVFPCVASSPWVESGPEARAPVQRECGRFFGTRSNAKPSCVSVILAFLVIAFIASGCRSLPPLPALDLTQPGWRTYQGQAVWRSGYDAPEITGELFVAVNSDGRGLVQFTKTPLPMVVARLDAQRWQIEFPADNRRFSGSGDPPGRLLWLVLLKGLREPRNASTALRGDGRLVIENDAGEKIEGYLTPEPKAAAP